MTFSNFGSFPRTRLRRLRRTEWLRRLNQETVLTVHDLIWPVFIREEGVEAEVRSMPGIQRYTLDEISQAAADARALNIPAIALFPCVPQEKKSNDAAQAFDANNLVCQAIRLIKAAVPELGVIVDVALDPYTCHGHDGIMRDNDVDNDLTVAALVQQALTLAQAGADVVAPSDMMDGRVGAIRAALDGQNFIHTAILSYSAKYASSFYGPFREALGSGNNLGRANKKTYQMNPANRREALREVAQDIAEGADMVIVKPGLPCLDIIRMVKETFSVPTYAYQVSGEYAMIQAAHAQGWIDGGAVMQESLTAMKRAGADGIFTYAALAVAKELLR